MPPQGGRSKNIQSLSGKELALFAWGNFSFTVGLNNYRVNYAFFINSLICFEDYIFEPDSK